MTEKFDILIHLKRAFCRAFGRLKAVPSTLDRYRTPDRVVGHHWNRVTCHCFSRSQSDALPG